MQIPFNENVSRIRHPVEKIGDLSNPEENVLGISYWKKASSFDFSSKIKNYIRNSIENFTNPSVPFTKILSIKVSSKNPNFIFDFFFSFLLYTQIDQDFF